MEVETVDAQPRTEAANECEDNDWFAAWLLSNGYWSLLPGGGDRSLNTPLRSSLLRETPLARGDALMYLGLIP